MDGSAACITFLQGHDPALTLHSCSELGFLVAGSVCRGGDPGGVEGVMGTIPLGGFLEDLYE